MSETELLHAGGFLLSEAPGYRSREKLYVASGQDLDAGELVMLSAGKLVAYDGATASQVHGVLFAAVDASAADVMATFIARDAEVRLTDLTYPAGTQTLSVNELLELGIVCR
jgi:hypothetical protein